MRSANRPVFNHIELFPAALLPRRAAWQGIARALLGGSWLLVLSPDNAALRQTTLALARRLREHGKRVVVWTVGEKGYNKFDSNLVPAI